MSEPTTTPDVGCPHCGALINRASEAYGDIARPEPGDFSVCLYCARVCVFESGLLLRQPTAAEEREFFRDRENRRVVAAIKAHGPRDPGRRSEEVPRA